MWYNNDIPKGEVEGFSLYLMKGTTCTSYVLTLYCKCYCYTYEILCSKLLPLMLGFSIYTLYKLSAFCLFLACVPTIVATLQVNIIDIAHSYHRQEITILNEALLCKTLSAVA